MPSQSASQSDVVHIENGEQVYPCRCGETHRGEHGVYDYGHHNCFHDVTLLFFECNDPSEGDVMCPQCGKTWAVRNAS